MIAYLTTLTIMLLMIKWINLLLPFYCMLVYGREEIQQFCKEDEYSTGSWIKDEPMVVKGNSTVMAPAKSFLCCSWDHDDYLFDRGRCGTKPNKYYTGLNDAYTLVGGNACNCDATSPLGRYSISQRETYVWRPNSCDLPVWNATLFCSVLGKRNILFVGDSTMQQTASSLMNMIYHGRGGCSSQIALYHDNRLNDIIPEANGTNIFSVIGEFKPDIIVVNVGAHFHSIQEFELTLNGSLAKLFESTLNLKPSTKFIWKSQNPGHVDCSNIKLPYVKHHHITDAKVDPYFWRLFPIFDSIARKFTEQMSKTLSKQLKDSNVFRYLNMSMLYLRPDGHPPGDCLHFCLPGALDVFSNILLNMLINEQINDYVLYQHLDQRNTLQ